MNRENGRPRRGLDNLSNIEVIYVPPRKLAPKTEPPNLPSVIVAADNRPKTRPPTRPPGAK